MNSAIGVHIPYYDDDEMANAAQLHMCTDKLQLFCHTPTDDVKAAFIRTILLHNDDIHEIQNDKYHVFVLSQDGAYNSLCAHRSASDTLRAVERENAAMSYANALFNTSQKWLL